MPDPIASAPRTPEYAPEFRLLLACARNTQCPVDVERIVGICHGSVDWLLFLRLVVRHRVAPLVWRRLSGIGDLPVPQEIRNDLRRRVGANTLNALKQAGELVRLVRRFEGVGIRVLPLKGPVVAVQVYGALKLRHAGDLDLLVDPASVADADRILQDSGYIRSSPDYPLGPGQTAAYMKIRKDFSYFCPDTATYVELHWRWSQNACLLPLSLDEVWQHRELVEFGSESVAAIPRRELLLYLCAHGAHTGWFRLKWLCDVAELTGDEDRIDMSQAMARAQELGVERVLAQGLLLAHRMLEVPLPGALPADMHQDRTVRSLVHQATEALLQNARHWSTDDTPVSFMPRQLRYRMRLRRDLRYKWHNLYFYSLWTDNWRWIRLPDRLSALYLVLAPFVWIASLFRKPSSGGGERKTGCDRAP
jgi:hypothetical protein